MIKIKKNLALTMVLLTIVLFTCSTCCFFNSNVASALTNDEDLSVAQPLGLMTQISVTIGTYSDKVAARAHNDFTLGFATVQVYVYLYSSLEYETDYNKMNLESSAYIGDLNINKTLETSAPIDGVKRYWKACIKTKLDKKDWQYKETGTYLVDETGNFV